MADSRGPTHIPTHPGIPVSCCTAAIIAANAAIACCTAPPATLQPTPPTPSPTPAPQPPLAEVACTVIGAGPGGVMAGELFANGCDSVRLFERGGSKPSRCCSGFCSGYCSSYWAHTERGPPRNAGR